MYMGERLQRIGLVAAMSVTAVNVWLGAPLAGLWVGSRLAGDSGISMAAVAAVVIVALAVGFSLVRVLAVLGVQYERVSGIQRTVHRQLPWLRSMRGERPHDPHSPAAALTALDYVLILVVMACMIAFEIWFFFFSSSPIDQRSGR